MNKIYLIGNAHIDPVWLWRWQEGFAEIKATFRSALDRMDEYPDFVFTSACASYYKWVEENEPAMFEEIRKRVLEGRWEITGGWWLQPDCNIPSGESFSRHSLYAQRYFMDKFGKTASVGYNVDSFGHNGMLPQILKKSGMDYYVFMRPDRNEKQLDSDAFIWESPDGSRVKAFRIINGYNNDLNEERIQQRLEAVRSASEKNETPVMFFYGVGNHGGGPTRAVIELFEKLNDENDFELSMSRTDSYFQALESCETQLPVVREDLQHHASGCYSTTAMIKNLNRKAENRLVFAEKTAFISDKLFNTGYDKQNLQKAWEDVLFNQFHDIMGGCSIRPAYDDAFEFYGEALKIAADIQNASLQKISWNVNTTRNKKETETPVLEREMENIKKSAYPLFVFNPNARAVKAPVRCRFSELVEGPNGKTMETQTVRSYKTDKDRKWDTMFLAELPPLGYKVYWLYRETEEEFESAEADTVLSYGENHIENKRYRVEFDKSTGWISSLLDKENGHEVFTGPGAVPVVIDDSESDTWAHGITSFRNEIGRFSHACLKITENGPLRVTMRVESKFGNSLLIQNFSLYKGMEGIFVSSKLNWQESRKILKLSFPVNLSNPGAVYEIPYGFIRKKPDGQEEAGQNWFAVDGTTSNGEPAGFYSTNDSKYSYDIKESEMRMTVVRSAFYADHFGDHDEFNESMDIGINRFSYTLHPFKGTLLQNHPAARAMEINNPPMAIPETFHDGPLPLENSFLKVDADNIVVHALKMSEDGNDAILRCVETAGVTSRVDFDFGLMEKKWSCVFSPFEIKTFRIGNEILETNLIETKRGVLID